MRWSLRFLRVADPMPAWFAVLSILIGGYAISVAVADRRSVDEALAVLLLWQMLSASSGFGRAAAAGHFDSMLVRIDRRLSAAAHLIHSVWPVALAWAVVSLVEWFVHRDTPRALEAGRLSAFLFISVTCWALSLPGSRLTAGVVWLLLIVSLVTTSVGPDQYAAMLSRPEGSAMELLHAAALVVACPFLMLGTHVPPREAVAVVLLLLSLVAGGCSILFVARRDYPLEPSS